MRGILISTTNTIQGAEIEEYIDLVFSNVVIGTNVFSDIGASFTDFFGGLSGTYKKKLTDMRELAMSEIKLKASSMGADAIIGLRVDIDEISGKGKSMFMISVSGTAVKVKQKHIDKKQGFLKDSEISTEVLNSELVRRKVLLKLEKKLLPSEEQWEYLMKWPDYEITVKLLPICLYFLSEQEGIRDEKFVSNYYNLIKMGDTNLISEFLYNNLLESDCTDSKQIVKIIHDNNLFNSQKIKELIDKNKVHNAIICLSATKEYYSREDLILMKQISSHIKQLPDTGRIESVKSGLMAKEKEKFICENGHKNDVDFIFCLNCGINVKGLTAEECKNIDVFSNKVDSLEYLFDNNN